MGDTMEIDNTVLRKLDDEVWVVDQPLGVMGIEIGMRMTVIRLPDGDLWLHSPVILNTEVRAALDALGPVRHIVAPNKVHHLFFAECAAHYPDARCYAAPGLTEKRPDISFDEVLEDTAPEAWRDVIDQQRLQGAPLVEETVFHHRPSRTLILTDLAFNVRESANWISTLFFKANGVLGQFGPSRMFRLMIRDRDAARRSLDAMLAWDFDRIVVTHGAILQEKGHRVLRDAYQWIG
jgi:hypothetical protein